MPFNHRMIEPPPIGWRLVETDGHPPEGAAVLWRMTSAPGDLSTIFFEPSVDADQLGSWVEWWPLPNSMPDPNLPFIIGALLVRFGGEVTITRSELVALQKGTLRTWDDDEGNVRLAIEGGKTPPAPKADKNRSGIDWSEVDKKRARSPRGGQPRSMS